MKNIFKKIAVVALAMIMCVSAAMPVAFAADAKCPGEENIHTSMNCDYTVIAQTEASCEAEGFVTGKCNGCSATFVASSVAELGHDWDEAVADCLSASTKTCKRCGKEETIPGTATGHAFGEWITKGDKGCFEGNRRYRVCSLCEYTEEETMRDAHSWIVAVYAEPANCIAPGKATYVCENSGCGATKTAELWAKGENASHNYQKWDSDAAAALVKGQKDPNAATQTCVRDGARTEICVDCGEIRVIYTLAKNYAHTFKDMVFVDAVLDTNGCKGSGAYAYWECVTCGVMYQQTESVSSSKATKYYAKYGTVAPAYEYDKIPGDASDYYLVYYDYEYKDFDYYLENNPDVLFVAGSEFKKITKPDTIWGSSHAGRTIVNATCTTEGFTMVDCNKCGMYSFTSYAATGHLFYPEVASGDRVTVMHNLGVYKNSTTSATSNWSALGNVNKYLGENYNVWDRVYAPTCTDNAKVVWCCLNVDKNKVLPKEGSNWVRMIDGQKVTVAWEAYTQCTETKEAFVTGTRNAPYGHILDDSAKTVVKEATCTESGIYDYTCPRAIQYYEFDGVGSANKYTKVYTITDETCGLTERKIVPALGHKFVEDGEANVTCKEDGVQNYICSNDGCTETKEETVVSEGTEHNWVFLSYVTENTAPSCISEVKGYAYCSVCDKDQLNVQLITIDALGHDYLEIDDEVKEFLNAKGDKAYVDANGVVNGSAGKAAVELLAVGSCTTSVSYKLNCLADGCNFFSVVEPDKDNVKESHDVVVATGYYNELGVYDPQGDNDHQDGAATFNKLTCTTTTTAYYWYCKNKNCVDYRTENLALMDANGNPAASKWVDKNGNPATLNKFEYYGTHFNPETGKDVTIKDVPDERISGAESIAEAQKVKAPVDENGNITAYAIEIPGTSLVWRYVIDEVSCDADAVTTGGFYCVACDSASLTNVPKSITGDTRAKAHKLVEGTTVPETCLAYGYTPNICKNCDYTVQTNYVAKRASHVYDVASPISVIKATCEAAGARIYQCTADDCRQLVTLVDAPLGHYNVSGDELLRSCLDPNATIENRRCKNCMEILIPACNYVNGICVECGSVKKD